MVGQSDESESGSLDAVVALNLQSPTRVQNALYFQYQMPLKAPYQL
jgi:hypothetical protein